MAYGAVVCGAMAYRAVLCGAVAYGAVAGRFSPAVTASSSQFSLGGSAQTEYSVKTHGAL